MTMYGDYNGSESYTREICSHLSTLEKYVATFMDIFKITKPFACSQISTFFISLFIISINLSYSYPSTKTLVSSAYKIKKQ